MSKQCLKCGEIKSLSEFYAHRQMGDGHLGKCKDCTRKDTEERRAQLEATDREWVLSERRRHREKSRRYRAAGRAKKVSREKKAETSANYRRQYPLKAKARRKVQYERRRGRLVSKPCEQCGFPIAQGHHEDYSRPLDLTWLCVKHHMERHVQIRDAAILTTGV